MRRAGPGRHAQQASAGRRMSAGVEMPGEFLLREGDRSRGPVTLHVPGQLSAEVAFDDGPAEGPDVVGRRCAPYPCCP